MGKSRYEEALPLFTLISLTPPAGSPGGRVTVLTDLRRLRLPPRPMMTGILADWILAIRFLLFPPSQMQVRAANSTRAPNCQRTGIPKPFTRAHLPGATLLSLRSSQYLKQYFPISPHDPQFLSISAIHHDCFPSAIIQIAYRKKSSHLFLIVS